MDANFRLKNGMNSTYARDPSLGPGWAYFVKDEPYFEHLRNYISEADVSHNPSLGWCLTELTVWCRSALASSSPP